MILSRSSRRLVAGITALLLVACQSLAVAHACMMSAPQVSAGMAIEPCHGTGQQPAGEDNTRQASCPSQYVSSSSPDITLLAVTDLLPISASVYPLAPASVTLRRVALHLARIEPPPLPILHCRLRN